MSQEAFPKAGETIAVRLGSETEGHRAVVKSSVKEGRVELAVYPAGLVTFPDPGASLTIVIGGPDAASTLLAEIERVDRAFDQGTSSEVISVRVLLPESYMAPKERNFFRVEVQLPVKFYEAELSAKERASRSMRRFFESRWLLKLREHGDRALTVDLGGGGMAIQSPRAIAVDRGLLCQVGLGPEAVLLTCRVAWSHPDKDPSKFLMGLQFVNIDPPMEDKIVNFIFNQERLGHLKDIETQWAALEAHNDAAAASTESPTEATTAPRPSPEAAPVAPAGEALPEPT